MSAARFIGGMLKSAIRSIFVGILALSIVGGVVWAANYTATQGTGTTFASAVISAVNYTEFLLCDATAGATQCAAVNSSGQLAVQAPPTLPLPSGAATAANQSTEISSLSTIATNTGAAVPAGTNNIGSIDILGHAGGTLDGTAGSAASAVLSVQGISSMTPLLANPGTAANWGVGATGSAVPANAGYGGGDALSSEPSKATTGNLTGAFLDLTGKTVTSPFANRENMVRGSASETGTSAGTLLAGAGGSLKNYVTDVECGRTDAGTTAIYVTFSDAASTILVLPNNGGGGGNNKTFNVPLATAGNTAFTFTASSGVSTVYCSAQGFTGY